MDITEWKHCVKPMKWQDRVCFDFVCFDTILRLLYLTRFWMCLNRSLWIITISVLFILVYNNGFKLHRIGTESANSDGSIFRAKDASANRSAPLAKRRNAHHPPFSGSERQAIHHSMLIQGLLTNGTFERINPYKYRNPTITSITVLFTPN